MKRDCDELSPRPARWEPLLAGLAAAAWVMGISLLFGNDLARLSITGRWFQSDGWRVFDDMTVFDANHFRTSVRPWFSLVYIPVTNAIGMLTGLEPLARIWVANALAGGVLAALLWLIVRRLGGDRVAAAMSVALLMSSSGFLFWLAVPETYALGAIALMLCVWIVSIERLKDWQLVLVGGLAFGSAITNGMGIAAAALSRRRFVRAVLVGCAALACMKAGWLVQRVVFPEPAGRFWVGVDREMGYIGHDWQGGPLRSVRVLMTSAGAVPHLEESRHVTEASPQGAMLSVQWSDPNEWGLLTIGAVGGWCLLLIGGAWHLFRLERCRAVCWTVAAIALGQIAFHAAYGEEAFLYVLHLTPLLVVIASASVIRWRSAWFRLVFAAVVVLMLANSVTQLRRAAEWPAIDAPDDRLERLDGSAEPGEPDPITVSAHGPRLPGAESA